MPSRIRDLKDVNLGTLDNSKNKNLIRYNSTSGKFESVSIDTLLGFSTDTPNSFVDVVTQELDPNNILLKNVDGGSF